MMIKMNGSRQKMLEVGQMDQEMERPILLTSTSPRAKHLTTTLKTPNLKTFLFKRVYELSEVFLFCIFVCIFIFLYSQNIGLYRDDGLAACNGTPQETEKIKKGICKVFRDNDL